MRASVHVLYHNDAVHSFAQAPSFEEAEAALELEEWQSKGARPSSSVTIIVVDIDKLEVPPQIMERTHVRYLFVCSDTHRRRLLQAGKVGMFASLPDYALLSKPVKRQELWLALLSRGQRFELPRPTLDRPVTNFNTAGSFRRRRVPRGTETSQQGFRAITAQTEDTPQSSPSSTLKTQESSAASRYGHAHILLAEDNPTNIMVSCTSCE